MPPAPGPDKRDAKPPLAPCLAVFGTGSDVGKSVIVTGLCRYFRDKGLRVAPFKAQNMSNNAGVTPEGLEMGRAQIVQAEAARIPPHVDMNPVLLKPTSEVGAQIVCLGAVLANASAVAYQQRKEKLFETAKAALDRLRRRYDLVIMEGAGSCAEVNLMDRDIVNFQMAQAADAPVVLVADIHRGGVFAQVVGTLACLPDAYRRLVAGFIINRFLGDLALFKDGVDWIETRTDRPCFGVVPWFTHFEIEQEDSVVIEQPQPVTVTRTDKPAIAVIRIPHISNFTDFDPLKQINAVALCYIEKPQDLTLFTAVILPGSKNTRFDLNWLKKTGWDDVLCRYAADGGALFGICGGYQMLGRSINDPDGLEGPPGSTPGLGLLPVVTTLRAPKTTTLTKFSYDGAPGSGYEIHMGHTHRLGGDPLVTVTRRNDQVVEEEEGCRVSGKSVMGTYLHGFFDSAPVIRKWLNAIGLEAVAATETVGPSARDRDYDLLADHLATHLDLEPLFKLMNFLNP